MKSNIYCSTLFSLLLVTSTAQAQFVGNSFETGKSLGRKTVELAPSFSHYIISYQGESAVLSNNFGIRAGFGLSKQFDLKFRYERFFFPRDEFSSNPAMHFYSLVPKYSIADKGFSVMLPLSLYSISNNELPDEPGLTYYSISPQFLKTITARNHQTDVTFAVRCDYFIFKQEELDNDFLLGLNIGTGLSSDLRKWAIRPELGLQFKPGEAGIVWNLGIGLQVLLNRRN